MDRLNRMRTTDRRRAFEVVNCARRAVSNEMVTASEHNVRIEAARILSAKWISNLEAEAVVASGSDKATLMREAVEAIHGIVEVVEDRIDPTAPLADSEVAVIRSILMEVR